MTRVEDAAAHDELLRSTIIPGIEASGIAGFRHIDLMRRMLREEVKFTTIMWFDDLTAIEAFVGEDVEAAHVPASARSVLARFDEQATHYQVFDRREQGS